MARSSYVYVLEDTGQPPMAWTVKHELRTWLSRLPSIPVDWRLWRVPDGQPDAARTTMSIPDVLAGK